MNRERKSYSEKMEEHIDEVFYYWNVVYEKMFKLYGKQFVENHPEVVANIVHAIATKDLEASIQDVKEDLNDILKK